MRGSGPGGKGDLLWGFERWNKMPDWYKEAMQEGLCDIYKRKIKDRGEE